MPDERTEVMSLDELMDLASEPSTAPTVQIRRYGAPTEGRTASPPAAAETPIPAPAPLNPGNPQPIAQRPAAQRGVARPNLGVLLEQSGERISIAGDQAQDWLRQGDNGLIAATALIALLLLVVVISL